MRRFAFPALIAAFTGLGGMAQATLVDLGECRGPVNGCRIENDLSKLPERVSKNPNNGILLGWDEVQNFTLTEALYVDRVVDPTASFVTRQGGGYLISAGTVVSSHYLQWDPLIQRVDRVVQTEISTDSEIFGMITLTDSLQGSDFLGRAGMTYETFFQRGIEKVDSTEFRGNNVAINWGAGAPGDWARLITAFSAGGASGPGVDPGGNGTPGTDGTPNPGADPDPTGGVSPVPLPAGLPLLGGALLLLGGGASLRRRGA